jgi:uncharacterized Zn-finger protein
LCQLCFKQLSSKQNLKQHMNIHTGERPYRCTVQGCFHAYKHASQLSHHRLVHLKYSKTVRPRFDDIKDLAKLIIIALSGELRKDYSAPEGPFSSDDVHLPLITEPQKQVELRSFSELCREQ